jgi:hypothetical protein
VLECHCANTGYPHFDTVNRKKRAVRTEAILHPPIHRSLLRQVTEKHLPYEIAFLTKGNPLLGLTWLASTDSFLLTSIEGYCGLM